MSKKRVIVVLGGFAALAVLTVVGAACGGGGGSSGGMGGMAMGTTTSGQKPDVVVDVAVRNMRFEPASLSVPGGKVVQINLRNMDGTEHDMQVGGLKVEMLDGQMAGDHAGMAQGMVAMHTLANGSASMMFRSDQKGTYAFICTMPGHKDAGMVGEITVT